MGDISSVTTLDFPERITSMLWVGRRLLVACESGSLVIIYYFSLELKYIKSSK